MKMGVRINTRNLRRSIVKLARVTKEDKANLANSSAKFVAIHVYRNTDKTTAGAIREELNQPRGPHTLAETIIAARARKTGRWPKGRYAVRREAKRFVSRQASSSSWLRAGMLPAMLAFGAKAAQLKRFRNRPGAAGRARRGIRRPVAFIEHFDPGFVERHPTLFQQAVNKQTAFLERLAYKKMVQNVRRSRT